MVFVTQRRDFSVQTNDSAITRALPNLNVDKIRISVKYLSVVQETSGKI